MKNIIVNESTDFLFNGNNKRFHSPLEIIVPIEIHDASMHSYICNVVNSCDYIIKKDFNKVEVDEINLEFSRIDWGAIFTDKDVNNCLDSFYCEVNKIIDNYVPKLIIYLSKFPKWFSTD